MGYQALIDKNLDKAFSKIQDLAIDVTITRNSASFNFSTSAATLTPEAPLTVKAVVIDINKDSKEYNYLEKQIMFKSIDFIDITTYDTVVIGSDTWKIGTRINNSGYIYLINIYKDK